MMRSAKPDLHVHSDKSDGVLSPRAVVETAVANGVTVLAVTDHDTFAGSDELRACTLPIPVIPGTEMSMSDMPGLHLLAYGTAPGEGLREKVSQLRNNRVNRAREMLERLRSIGISLDWDELLAATGDSIGRPHVARALVHHGYAASMQEAFDRYIGHGKPAYVPGERMNMAQALPLIRENGFIPVLAHPCELHVSEQALDALVARWCSQGLMGIEVYHPSAVPTGFTALEHLARRYGLLVTGGSDFHQEADKHWSIGRCCDVWQRAPQDLEALIKALG